MDIVDNFENITIDKAIFIYNIERLAEFFNTRKGFVKKYMIKHFRENVNFIITKPNINLKDFRGGKNKENILLTNETFELIKASYNLRNNYATTINNTNIKNTIIMSVENSTIGFIQEIFKNIITMKRQYKIENYRIDLYVPKYKLAIECDEFDHKNYKNEIIRQTFIEDKLKCKFIRFNPCDKDFNLAKVINELNIILFYKFK